MTALGSRGETGSVGGGRRRAARDKWILAHKAFCGFRKYFSSAVPHIYISTFTHTHRLEESLFYEHVSRK